MESEFGSPKTVTRLIVLHMIDEADATINMLQELEEVPW